MNDDNDIAIENNKFVLVNGDEEIRQRLIQNLQTFFQEWFLDLDLGIAYHQIIFKKGTAIEVIEDLFKDEIISTQGVQTLERFDPLDLDGFTRSLKVKFGVQTVNSTFITIERELP
jgi:hypothetical protein